MSWMEIARTGTFTDSAGRAQTFTAADLAAIAKSYDPQKRDCPLVFGHPQSDSAPAFGWAQNVLGLCRLIIGKARGRLVSVRPCQRGGGEGGGGRERQKEGSSL